MSVGDLLVGSRLHHVGLVVADLDLAITNYQALGFGAEDRFDVPEQGIQAAFFPLAQGAVELIQPTDPEGAIGRFMAKRGEGFHHVAYAVGDLDASLKQLAKAGIELIDHTPRIGGHGLMIAFVHPRACNGVLTELVQDEGRAGRRGHIERCMERLEPGVGSSGGMLLPFTGSSSPREAGGSQMGGKAGG